MRLNVSISRHTFARNVWILLSVNHCPTRHAFSWPTCSLSLCSLTPPGLYNMTMTSGFLNVIPVLAVKVKFLTIACDMSMPLTSLMVVVANSLNTHISLQGFVHVCGSLAAGRVFCQYSWQKTNIWCPTRQTSLSSTLRMSPSTLSTLTSPSFPLLCSSSTASTWKLTGGESCKLLGSTCWIVCICLSCTVCVCVFAMALEALFAGDLCSW